MTAGSIALPHSGATDEPPSGPEGQIELYRQDFATVLPSHLKADTWIRVAQGLLRRDYKLRRVAKENVPSFLAALLDCARLGLEPGETYHLVPFGKEIVGIEDYKGLIELMYRAGAVESVKAEIVYEYDEYDFDPDTMKRPHHRPSALKTGRSNWFAAKEQRGEMVGAYCYCEMKGGGTSRVVQMAEWEIDEHRKASKTSGSADSMWQKWPRSAWLKTVVKEQSKWVPTSPEWITHKILAERLDQQPAPELSAAARSLPEASRDVSFPDRDSRSVIEGEVIHPTASPADGEVLPDDSGRFDRAKETRHMFALLKEGGIDPADRDTRLLIMTRLLNRPAPLESFHELTDSEIAGAVTFMRRHKDGGTLPSTLNRMGEVTPATEETDSAPRKGKGEMSAEDIDMARNEIAGAKDMAQLSEVWNQLSKRFVMGPEVRKAHTSRRDSLKQGPGVPMADTDALWQQILENAPEDWTTKQIEDHFWTITGAAVDKATAEDMQRYIDTPSVPAAGSAE